MPIARKGKFFVFPDMAHTPGLGIESVQLKACVQEIRSKRIKGAFGSPGFGFRESSLDALCDLKHLEAVWFFGVKLRNVDALYTLPKLKHFGVHPTRPAVDFARLPALQSVVWFHKAADTGIKALQRLKDLRVWHFKPRSSSFGALELPTCLTQLHLLWANPQTLDGLSAIPRLRRLELHRCSKLQSLSLIPDLFPALDHLVVSTCPRIKIAEAKRIVAKLPKLKFAIVNGEEIV